jgi:hypothetical protein
MPGVEHVALAGAIPFGPRTSGAWVAHPRTGSRVNLGYDEVSSPYFEALGIPLLAGRTFARADEAAASVAIVNEAAAQALWPEESPLGKTLLIGRPLTVVALVRNFHAHSIGSEREPFVWVASMGSRSAQMLIRHAGTSEALIRELPKAAREIDRHFLASVEPYHEMMDRTLRSYEITAAIATGAGAVALLLACVGIYGVASYNVSQRTREVGVRVALGARPGAILAMILRQNLRTVAFGAVVGLAGAIGLGRLLISLLVGITPADPLAIAATVAVLFATAILATWGPARRASRVDPAITLRHE